MTSGPMCGRCARNEYCPDHSVPTTKHRFITGINHGPGLPPRCLANIEESLYTCLKPGSDPVHSMNCQYCRDTGMIWWSDVIYRWSREGPVWIKDEKHLACDMCETGILWKEIL